MNSEKFNEKISDINLEISENGVPLVLNKEGEKVESVQFKELIKMTRDREKAGQIYNKIKELESGELKNSKLKDENGELMIVWHGSSRKFEKFNPEAKGEWRWRNKGVHFQSSKETIEQYAKKAKSAWNNIAYNIGLEYFGMKYGSDFTDGQDKKTKEIFNEIIEDIIENGENSKFYHKNYLNRYNKEKGINELTRDPCGDAIIYGKHQFGTEWALEIFGGEMPNKENCSINKKYGTYFGNDIGEYKYATLLSIEKPFYKEAITASGLDYAFEDGEKSHREKGTDGAIITHLENLKDMAGREIADTKNTYSASIFDENKIKIIGIETEKGFEVRKEFLRESA